MPPQQRWGREDFGTLGCWFLPFWSDQRWSLTPASLSLAENDTIYWVDMGLSTISRAKRDQTWREDVVTNGIGRVEGIAVDWIAGGMGL